jgi:SPP1 gp7 family putative phage head morphogenesis protein
VNATLTRARADFVGATHYVWRTMQDEQVRPAHADLEGEVCSFADPPEVEGEGAHHPGEFPNCRCFAEPILPDALEAGAAD